MPRKRRAPSPRVYPDQWANYGAAESIVGDRRIHAAAVRSDRMHRALALLRDRIPPSRYESFLKRLDSTMGQMDAQAIRAADRAQAKLYEIEDEIILRICQERGIASPGADLYADLGYDDPAAMAEQAAVAAQIRDLIAMKGVSHAAAIRMMDLDGPWDLWHIVRLHVRYHQTDELRTMLADLRRALGIAEGQEGVERGRTGGTLMPPPTS